MWVWRCIVIHEQLARFCAKTLEHSWKTETKSEVIYSESCCFISPNHTENNFSCIVSAVRQSCKIVGICRRGREGVPVVLTAVLCPVLLSVPDSWIYNGVPGQPHSTFNRWKHPSPNSSTALGSRVSQGKGGRQAGGDPFVLSVAIASCLSLILEGVCKSNMEWKTFQTSLLKLQ